VKALRVAHGLISLGLLTVALSALTLDLSTKLLIAIALGLATVFAANFALWRPRSPASAALAAAIAAAYALAGPRVLVASVPAGIAMLSSWALELAGRRDASTALGSLGVSLLVRPLASLGGGAPAGVAIAWASSALAVSLAALGVVKAANRARATLLSAVTIAVGAALDLALGCYACALALAPPAALTAALSRTSLRDLGSRPLRRLGTISAAASAASFVILAVAEVL
jgi:hypothetical protein